MSYMLLGGFEDETNPWHALAACVGQIRGKWEPGLLLMMGNWVPVFLPAFEWNVSWPRRRHLKVRYALPDVAVLMASSFKFTLIAVDTSGKEHVLVEETIKQGNKTVYDRKWKLDYPVAKIRIVYDNLGNMGEERVGWNRLWFCPEVKLPK